MKSEMWAQAMMLTFGFIAGMSATAYLVLSDPEVRMMFRAKSNRMSGTGWSGIAKEAARATVLEMRESFPRWAKEMTE